MPFQFNYASRFGFIAGSIMRDLMAIILLIALIALPQTNSIKKCPIECTCDLDVEGRYAAICERGNAFDAERYMYLGNCILIFL